MNTVEKEEPNPLSSTRSEPKQAITAKTSKENEIQAQEAPNEGEEDPISRSGRRSTVKSINKELKRKKDKPLSFTEKDVKLVSQSSKKSSQMRGKNRAKFASNDISKEPSEAEKELFGSEKVESIEKELQSILEKVLPDILKVFEASEKEKDIEKEIQAILEKVLPDILKVFEASEKEETTKIEMKAIPEEKPADILAKAEKEMQAIIQKAIFKVLTDIPTVIAALEERGYTEKEMLAIAENMQFHVENSEALGKEDIDKEEQAFVEKCLASFYEEFSKTLEKEEITEEEKQAILAHFPAKLRPMDPLGTLAESSNSFALSNPNKEIVKPVWTPKRKYKSKKKRW